MTYETDPAQPVAPLPPPGYAWAKPSRGLNTTAFVLGAIGAVIGLGSALFGIFALSDSSRSTKPSTTSRTTSNRSVSDMKNVIVGQRTALGPTFPRSTAVTAPLNVQQPVVIDDEDPQNEGTESK